MPKKLKKRKKKSRPDRRAVLKTFRATVLKHYRMHGRDFPWRRTKNPYCILVSEFMLQQTQTERVAVKYQDFLRRFPNFTSLSRASLRDVVRAWQGLGYNRRALALKRTAEIVTKEYKGKLPRESETLRTFPGIGPATAGATSAFAWNLPVVFVETNIRRVFIHFFFCDTEVVQDSEILELVEKTMDKKNPREWYWALMDYGAMLGKAVPNPNRRSAAYRRQSPFKGSDRELRGKILRLLGDEQVLPYAAIAKRTNESITRVKSIAQTLEEEGFILRRRERVMLAQ